MSQIINRNKIACRRAFTLVELIAVLAGLVIIMGVSMGLLFAMLDFQQRYDEQSEQLRSVNMFFAQFRDDARDASAEPVLVSDASFLIEWPTEAGKIRYKIVPGEFPEQQNVVREVWNGEKITGTETYKLPDYAVLWPVEGKDDNAGLIALNLWEHRPHTEAPDTSQLDPFARTRIDSPENPNDFGYWHTIIVRTPQTAEQGQ